MNKNWDGVERRNTAQLREIAEALLANIMSVQVQKRPVEGLLHELQIQQSNWKCRPSSCAPPRSPWKNPVTVT